MTYRVELTELAEADVASVLNWFRDQGALKAGARWFAQLMSRLETLASHPDRCAPAMEAEDIGKEIREILLGRGQYKYRILFQIRGNTVSILRVCHSSRDFIRPGDLGG